mmetsp:Transcript_39008/g.84070  ORF Transcript_39008/g.84070 Transcript_39008/m.84070 type:complete len:122 (+) Transcript_39008:310-675(+)
MGQSSPTDSDALRFRGFPLPSIIGIRRRRHRPFLRAGLHNFPTLFTTIDTQQQHYAANNNPFVAHHRKRRRSPCTWDTAMPTIIIPTTILLQQRKDPSQKDGVANSSSSRVDPQFASSLPQ